jgi:hypothetical protein
MNNDQTELSANYTQQQEVSIQNGYSSESDILTGKILSFPNRNMIRSRSIKISP